MVRNAWIVGRRAWVAAFARWLAPSVLAAFVALVSLLSLWLDDVWLHGVASLRGPQGWMAVVLVLVMPALTMRSFAGSSWEVTLPLSPGALVLGRWGAACAVAGVGVALTLPWALLLARFGALDWGATLAGYLGLGLWVAVLGALGIAASAWTRSQALAFLSAVGLGSLPWLLGAALPLVPAAWVPAVEAVSVGARLDALARGVVDLAAVAGLLGATVVGLRLAVLALELRRLR